MPLQIYANQAEWMIYVLFVIYIYVEINSTLKLMKQNAMHYKWLQQPFIMHSDLCY